MLNSKNKNVVHYYQQIKDFGKNTRSLMLDTQKTKNRWKVCVIGAGVMGSKIAAVLANASHEVVLLDIADKYSNDKNSIIRQALRNLQEQKPSSYTSSSRKELINIGNLDDDLALIQDCDLIIEAIVEKIEIKKKLYNKILPFIKKDAILSSNTSTLKLQQLKELLPTEIRPRFLITHFFNPPRYMDLLELVTDEETDHNVIDSIINFLAYNLGKTVINCNDSPGFIANRVGCFLLEFVVRKTIENNLDPIIIDNIFTNLFKLPSTAIFGLYDLIGHDILKLISTSLIKNLPPEDLYNKIYIETPILDLMQKNGVIGNKSKIGFYRIKPDQSRNKKEILKLSTIDIDKVLSKEDFETHYANVHPDQYQNEDFKSILELVNSNSEYGIFFREIIVKFYYYLLNLIPDVAKNCSDIDQAMKLGYSWKYGPFELLLDNIPQSVDWLAAQAKLFNLDVTNSFKENSIKVLREFEKQRIKSVSSELGNKILSNSSARLHEHNNMLIFSILTKMNILNQEVFELLIESVQCAEELNKNIIIYSDNSLNFSAGADLKFFIENIEKQNFDIIDKFLTLGQKALMTLKHATINVVSCPRGFALGGGCEVLLHSDFVVAHSELKAGLIETKLGVVPSFGGLKEMFLRSNGNADILLKNIKNVIYHNRFSSADQFFQEFDIEQSEIVMNKSHLLQHALDLNLSKKTVPLYNKMILPDLSLANEFDAKLLDDFQKVLLVDLQNIINHKVVSEQQLLKFEREIFLKYCTIPSTLSKLKETLK